MDLQQQDLEKQMGVTYTRMKYDDFKYSEKFLSNSVHDSCDKSLAILRIMSGKYPIKGTEISKTINIPDPTDTLHLIHAFTIYTHNT